jgi:uncharacterized protein YjgD (DUF1641 family)
MSRGVIANKFAVELNKEQYTGLISNMASLVFLLGDLNVDDQVKIQVMPCLKLNQCIALYLILQRIYWQSHLYS